MHQLKKLPTLLVLAAVGCDSGEGDDGTIPSSCATAEALPSRIDTDLTVSPGCYFVEDSVTVSAAALLTIEPGVRLEFPQGERLFINGGKLSAVGTADAPIVLTGAQSTRGYWEGVRFIESDFVENALEHVTIEYAGGAGGADAAALFLDDDNGSVRLVATDVTLRESAGFGLYLEGNQNAHELEMNRATITANARAAGVRARDLEDLGTTSTFVGNDDDAVVTGDDVDGDATWPALDVTYRVDRRIDVADAVITVSPGAMFEFDSDQGLVVESSGAFTAEGTMEAPILFTGAQATPGFWRGLVFQSTDRVENRLAHVVIEYGGSDTSIPANLFVDDDSGASRISITDSIFRESSGWGVYFEVNQNRHTIEAFDDVEIVDNARSVRIGSEDAGELSPTSSFATNEDPSILVVGDVETSQTWAALDAPYFVDSTVDIAEGATLEIASGTTVEMGEDAGVIVFGALASMGATDAPVTFTGRQATAGYWDTLRFQSTDSTDNALLNTVFEYGGGEAGDDSGLVFLDDDSGATRIRIEGSTFRESSNWGLYIEQNQNAPDLTCTDVTFESGSLADGAVGNRDGALPMACS